MTHVRVAIVGSRGFHKLRDVADYVNGLPQEVIIVSGGAAGVDSTAERTAREREMKVLIFRPNWKEFGRAAGPMRNREIVQSSEAVVAFWDGKSLGTRNTIELAKRMKKPITIVYSNGKIERW